MFRKRWYAFSFGRAKTIQQQQQQQQQQFINKLARWKYT